MSWLFSLAVVEDFLDRDLLDIASSVELKSTRTVEKSLCAVKNIQVPAVVRLAWETLCAKAMK